MICIVNGDILEAKENIVAFAAAVNDLDWNFGLLQRVKEQYPQVYHDFLKKIIANQNDKNLLLGQVSATTIDKNRLYVTMIIGDDNGFHFDAMQKACVALTTVAKKNKITVAMPYKIGYTKVGDWEEIESMLLEQFKDVWLTLYRKV